MKVWVKVVGGKMEEVKKCFSFTFHWPPSLEHSIGHQTWNIPLATKLGTFHWPPSLEHSIGHQAWNIPLATKHGTFHWPLSMDLPSPPFSFSLKGGLRSLGALSCLEDNFHAILNTCFHKIIGKANND
jgi:hypothetical protein